MGIRITITRKDQLDRSNLLIKYWILGNDVNLRFNVNVSHKSGHPSRNKKVTIKPGGQDTFQQLNDTLKKKFSELQDRSMNIFWKDDENRDIDIEDEDDLEEALKRMDVSEKSLWVVYGIEEGNNYS